MSKWIESTNILKWVKSDDVQLKDFLIQEGVIESSLLLEEVDIKALIRSYAKSTYRTEEEQKQFISALNKKFNYLKGKEKNKQEKISKIQLRISNANQQKLHRLSKEAEIDKSKFVENLIIYASSNPQLFFDEKLQQKLETSYIKNRKKELVKIDFKATSLDQKISTLEKKLTTLVTSVSSLLSEIEKFDSAKIKAVDPQVSIGVESKNSKPSQATSIEKEENNSLECKTSAENEAFMEWASINEQG